jgi:hypothetical protein
MYPPGRTELRYQYTVPNDGYVWSTIDLPGWCINQPWHDDTDAYFSGEWGRLSAGARPTSIGGGWQSAQKRSSPDFGSFGPPSDPKRKKLDQQSIFVVHAATNNLTSTMRREYIDILKRQTSNSFSWHGLYSLSTAINHYSRAASGKKYWNTYWILLHALSNMTTNFTQSKQCCRWKQQDCLYSQSYIRLSFGVQYHHTTRQK